MSRTLFFGIHRLLTLDGAMRSKGRRVTEEKLGLCYDALLVVDKGLIQWVGPRASFGDYLKSQGVSSDKVSSVEQFLVQSNPANPPWEGLFDSWVHLGNKTVLPSFIEAHTHSLFAGSRSEEFEQRLQGVTYSEIAARGGGILSTVEKTKLASDKELKNQLKERLQRFLRQGVTTIEVKTGYGLSLDLELRYLQLLADVKKELADRLNLVITFLGPHSLDPQLQDPKKQLASYVQALSQIRRHCSRADIFIEKGFFSPELAKPYLESLISQGFAVTIHADQLTLSGGSQLGVELGVQSVDHVLKIDKELIAKLANSELTCVLLPLADLYMKIDYPPARNLIDQGARVALATDFNPGTAPSQDVSLVGLLARLKMKMTLPEVLGAYVVGAAYALGLEKNTGALTPGREANFSVLADSKTEADLFYQAGETPVEKVFFKGLQVV